MKGIYSFPIMEFSFPENILSIIYLLNSLIVLTTIILLILENRESQTSILWILIIAFFPGIGLFLFIVIGRKWRRKKLLKVPVEQILSEYRDKHSRSHKQFLSTLEKNSECASDMIKVSNLLYNGGMASLTFSNEPELFFNGKDFFDRLFLDLERAKESIHMDFFIWKSDKLGEGMAKLLARKQSQGVKVKLIFDGLGSLMRISPSYRRKLKVSGISYHYFMDMRHWKSQLRINYNNHKKIVVIDGNTAYLGGMNMGQEYIDGGPYPYWRDTQIRLTGSAVDLVENAFLIDWSNCLGEDYPEELRPDMLQEEGSIPLQIALSGPDSHWSTLKLAYFTLISNANEEVLIQSPYFIPDQSIMEALISAALSGINIELMITGIPDKYTVWWAAHTYFQPLLEAGVRIFLYEKGFLHAKTFVVDKLISSVGTCNMDIRSFSLHYEINALIYHERTAQTLRNQYMLDRNFCREVKVSDMRKLPLLKKFRNSLMRIFSPLL